MHKILKDHLSKHWDSHQVVDVLDPDFGMEAVVGDPALEQALDPGWVSVLPFQSQVPVVDFETLENKNSE